jgi:fructose-bisphosphate aldolase class II
MFDGSALPLDENIAQTARVAEWAHANGISVEAELGFVGYRDGALSRGTDPAEVARFVAETNTDALAVAVGNVHLMTEPGAEIDRGRLAEIEAAAPGLPLVLHGGSGIAGDQRRLLAAETAVCKFNIGTELRMAFGRALRSALANEPDAYDRIQLLSATMPASEAAARDAITSLAR